MKYSEGWQLLAEVYPAAKPTNAISRYIKPVPGPLLFSGSFSAIWAFPHT